MRVYHLNSMTCEETVWLPGPPTTEFSGPHYCGEDAIGLYRVYGVFIKAMCERCKSSLRPDDIEEVDHRD